MEQQAHNAMRLHAAELDFGNGEREIRREPHAQAEWVGREVRELLSRKKHPVVEHPLVVQKRQVQTASKRRDQRDAHPDEKISAHWEKKMYPAGYLFVELGYD